MIVRARTNINEELLKELITGKKSFASNQESSFFFFNSGCSSLRFFLRLHGKGKKVGIQVFTCNTVLEAIRSEGDEAVFLDIDSSFYSTNLKEVKSKIHTIDILVLTHLFGIPNPEYVAIKNLCKENGVVLIDDLCQTFHSKIGDRLLEDVSDNYFYSFFYDKPISMMHGGMLKISNENTIRRKAIEIFSNLPKESEKQGRNNLKSLFLMHKILAPNLFSKEFRYGWGYKLVLKYWPIWGSAKCLNRVVKGMWVSIINRILNRLIKNQSEIKRMSNIEVKYAKCMLSSFANNNHILISFYERLGIKLPFYLTDKKITCSIGKRAIVNFHVSSEEAQVGLYNWPDLICDKSDYNIYPESLKVLENCTNIPTWTELINKVNISADIFNNANNNYPTVPVTQRNL